MVQRTAVRGHQPLRPRLAGRPRHEHRATTTRVSAVALVMESEADTAAASPRTPIDDGAEPDRRRCRRHAASGRGDGRRTPSRDERPDADDARLDVAAACYTGADQRKEVVRIVVTVLAGPWRWPAARRGWLDPLGGIHPGHRRQTVPGLVPPAAAHATQASPVGCTRRAPPGRPSFVQAIARGEPDGGASRAARIAGSQR